MRRTWRRVTRGLAAAMALGSAACALARSEVKTLRDRDVARVAFETAVPTTITALNEVPPRCGPGRNRRRSAEEFRVYEVVGTIQRIRRERDRDLHIVLADPEHARDRLVIELADPDARNGRRSPHRDRLAAAQRMFEDLQRQSGVRNVRELEGRSVRVTGVGFFDITHLQRGRSRSCIELHPVLSIEPAAK